MTLCIKCNRREAVPGGNLCEEDSIGGPPVSYIEGNYYISGGTQGVGDQAFRQMWNQEANGINLGQLALDLSKLREELKRRATTVEQDAAIGYVAAAESAATVGDGPTALRRLNAAGIWVFSVAKEIGVEAAAEAAKFALGL